MIRSLVVIPSYNSERTILRAVESVLNQTVETAMVVVDDVSTDSTETTVYGAYGQSLTKAYNRLAFIKLPHHEGGPARGRNRGLEYAKANGFEFVMFLDSDDEIHPEKIELQERALDASPHAGWTYCDVDIIDEVRHSRIYASEKYNYAKRSLHGYLYDQLSLANFIPVHAPLVRVAAIKEGFIEKIACEDWDFWTRLSENAHAIYVPKVLATYHRGRGGRSNRAGRLSGIEGQVRPIDIVGERIVLNLGCGTRDTRSWHPVEGAVNLDKSMGWTFESGLGSFKDGSVAGITVSHTLMYVPRSLWRYVFSEFHRVLVHRHDRNEPWGVLRVTEDDCFHKDSTRKGGWKGSEPAVTLTSASMTLDIMRKAGFSSFREVTSEQTSFENTMLCQRWHGDPPDVYFTEAIKL